MSTSLLASPTSLVCQAQNSVRQMENATASVSGRPFASYACSQHSSTICIARSSQMHKELHQQQSGRRQSICFATKPERRRQQQKTEEDDEEEDVRGHSMHSKASAMHLILAYSISPLCRLLLQDSWQAVLHWSIHSFLG